MTRGGPNFVVILADDLGYSDIGCYGSEVATPNLDALAGSGLRFSQAYNCARCCPTRAALLTGLYPHQAGVGHMVGNYGIREYQGYLRDDCVTIAEALKGGGYRTMMAGKWHVGGGYQANRPETWRAGTADHPLPVQRGFDTHYGMLGGGGSYFNPPSMVRDDQLIEAAAEAESYYLTDAISDRAVTMVEQATAAEAPFFLYVAYTAPHWPLHALPDDIARYEGRYRDGWDAVRTARHEQLKGLGVLDRHWGISPRDVGSRPWSEVRERAWEDRRMAVYAAQIECMDRGIGRIMAALRRAGVADDTLVLFLSDNGGCAEFLAEESASPEPFPLRHSDAGRPSDAHRQHAGGGARSRRHLPELRPAVGQRLQHPISPVQALGARGRHRHAAGGVVAAGDRAHRHHTPAGPRDRHLSDPAGGRRHPASGTPRGAHGDPRGGRKPAVAAVRRSVATRPSHLLRA